MLDTFKHLIVHQFEAALRTLDLCVEKCPVDMWNGRVANYKFCQVAFHALFYTDYYLGTDEESFRGQPFHCENGDVFRDYEEFADHAPVLLYDKADIKLYLEHCRQKVLEAIAVESAESLQASCGFARKSFSRAELHVYNIRHVQHHAAQLSLRLRLDELDGVPWVRSGWHDVTA